ncbi:carboxymuconolactone decarboxylase family protein [Niveibacterium sp. SC-1]|uniref:carboxymuconolactone decarboxylase family protein n=1 Tax=Niveibacterium sp. SC-1 TaxID=3135646 RepID=UPI00311EE178
MKARLDYIKAQPAAFRAQLALQEYVNASGIEPALLKLVKMRASQINGCAFCLDMNGREAMNQGETALRIILLDAWREAPIYTERERAALAWTEALTSLHEGHVPDAVYEEARAQFGESELVDLSLAITTINAWNRLSAAFRSVPAGV